MNKKLKHDLDNIIQWRRKACRWQDQYIQSNPYRSDDSAKRFENFADTKRWFDYSMNNMLEEINETKASEYYIHVEKYWLKLKDLFKADIETLT